MGILDGSCGTIPGFIIDREIQMALKEVELRPGWFVKQRE